HVGVQRRMHGAFPVMLEYVEAVKDEEHDDRRVVVDLQSHRDGPYDIDLVEPLDAPNQLEPCSFVERGRVKPVSMEQWPLGWTHNCPHSARNFCFSRPVTQ